MSGINVDAVGTLEPMANWKCVHYLLALYSVEHISKSKGASRLRHDCDNEPSPIRQPYGCIGLASIVALMQNVRVKRSNASLQFITSIIGFALHHVSQTNTIKIKP